MFSSFVEGQIRRTNRNLLLTNALLVLGVLAALALTNRYWYNFVAGPFPTDQQTVLATTDADTVRRYYLTLTGDEVIDPDWREVTVQKSRSGSVTSRKITAQYLALALGDRLLLVKNPTASTATTYTGKLVALPADIKAEIHR